MRRGCCYIATHFCTVSISTVRPYMRSQVVPAGVCVATCGGTYLFAFVLVAHEESGSSAVLSRDWRALAISRCPDCRNGDKLKQIPHGHFGRIRLIQNAYSIQHSRY